MTVLFIGEQPADRLPDLVRALRERCHAIAPFQASYARVCTFGRPPRVLVLEMGETPPGAFESCVMGLRDAVLTSGVDLAPKVLKREARAHLTLARFRGHGEAATLRPLRCRGGTGKDWVSDPLTIGLGAARVPCAEVTLFQSHLRPQGPVYVALDRFPLGHPDDTPAVRPKG